MTRIHDRSTTHIERTRSASLTLCNGLQQSTHLAIAVVAAPKQDEAGSCSGVQRQQPREVQVSGDDDASCLSRYREYLRITCPPQTDPVNMNRLMSSGCQYIC